MTQPPPPPYNQQHQSHPYQAQGYPPPQHPIPYGYGYPYQPPMQHPAMVSAVAVTRTKKDTNHLLHLVLTICTGGVWGIFVWLPITVWHTMGVNKKTSVTRLQ